MKTLLVGVAIAALVLVNAHDIAGAGQVGSVVKPNIRTPRIIVRPRIVTPKTNRLIKKNNASEVTNPAATQGGSAAEADSPVQSRTPPRLRKQTRVVVAIPRARPDGITLPEDGITLPEDGTQEDDRLNHYIDNLREPITPLFPSDSLRHALSRASDTDPAIRTRENSQDENKPAVINNLMAEQKADEDN